MVSFSVELTGAESVGGVSLCRTYRSRIGGCVLIQRSETFTEVLGVLKPKFDTPVIDLLDDSGISLSSHGCEI